MTEEEKNKLIALYLEQTLKTKEGKKKLKMFGGDKYEYFRFFKKTVECVEKIVMPFEGDKKNDARQSL